MKLSASGQILASFLRECHPFIGRVGQSALGDLRSHLAYPKSVLNPARKDLLVESACETKSSRTSWALRSDNVSPSRTLPTRKGRNDLAKNKTTLTGGFVYNKRVKRRRTAFHAKPRKPMSRSQIRPKRKVTKASIKRRKKGQWSTKTADDKFSIWIRDRDGKCLNCETREGLTCSHYHRRGHSATRFDPKNCITLCWSCHMRWEGPKNEYTAFMLKWLGEQEFIALALRAGTGKPRVEAVADFKVWYTLGAGEHLKD